MNAPTANTTSTYRTPEGQLIHNVIFNPDTGYYKWKDDQGKPCLLKADRFEQMMTPVLTEANFDAEAESDLPPHQQRVIAEKAELDEKIVKLHTFIETNPMYGTLDVYEQARLRVQRDHMLDYADALRQRIEAFHPAPVLTDEVNSLPSDELPAVTGFLADPVTVNDGDDDLGLLDDAPKSADETPKEDPLL